MICFILSRYNLRPPIKLEISIELQNKNCRVKYESVPFTRFSGACSKHYILRTIILSHAMN